MQKHPTCDPTSTHIVASPSKGCGPIVGSICTNRNIIMHLTIMTGGDTVIESDVFIECLEEFTDDEDDCNCSGTEEEDYR